MLAEKITRRNADEALRLIRMHKYEHTDTGIVLPKMGLAIAGHFETSVNGGPWDIDPNMVVTEGLTHIIDVALSQASQKAAFYIALFGGNVTVASTWTGANFTANSTEFTNYTEATRVAWVEGGAGAGAVNNNANPAVYTIGVGGGTVRGAALLETAAKSATTGVLIAAARFAADKVLAQDEELRVKYGITATST